MNKIYLENEISLGIVLIVGLFFVGIGHFYSQKFKDSNYYIVGKRNENTFSLTSSLTASALGAWVLFGPASAATFGGIGAVIGYSLGASMPLILLYNFGPKIRKEFPNGLSLTQFIKKRFGLNILKLCLFLILFYLIIFLIAEVTAIASLLNYLSNTPLWITSFFTLTICLLYVIRGGFKLSIITDKFQFIFIILILAFSFFLIMNTVNYSGLSLVKKNSPHLINHLYLNNYTVGLTFFIAVAATNLFHQGNWQRVFSAKNNFILKKSLIYSSIVIFLIVFWMGFTGLISYSINPKVIPDLAFFELALTNSKIIYVILFLILVLSLTLSTIDTLINAISSLIIVDGKNLLKSFSDKKIIKKTNYIILVISLIVLAVSSKGYSILYLFLIADLICCAAVVTIFFAFFKYTKYNNFAHYSIISGLFFGLLFFPNQSFEKSILVGNLVPLNYFNDLITQNLLFFSFILATLMPLFVIYSFKIIKYK